MMIHEVSMETKETAKKVNRINWKKLKKKKRMFTQEERENPLIRDGRTASGNTLFSTVNKNPNFSWKHAHAVIDYIQNARIQAVI